MFKNMSNAGIGSNSELDSQMLENQEKVDIVKRFVREVSIFLDKAEAFESENRADLMTLLNSKLVEYTCTVEALEKVLSEMTIQKVIEESFQEKGNRDFEHNIIIEEGNQKSVNSYLIQKIHTLEDRVNAKFDKELELVASLRDKGNTELDNVIQLIKDKELRGQNQFKELKSELQGVKNSMNDWAGHTLFYRMLFDLQIYKRVEISESSRLVESSLKANVSPDSNIYCVARMPDGRIIVDANNRATIVDEHTFEVVNELEPNTSQLVSVGF